MSAAPDSDVIIPPGTVVLDKYRVVNQIGVGGMGLVVQAIHASLGTSVAIKFLLPQFAASTEAGRRFVNEAKAASKIASEHIVRVFDAGTSQPYGPYIVMEYLHGHDLSRHLRKDGPFSIESALDFAVQAALALSEAHAHGIVHRDVKPANLFLVEQPDGAQLLKVLDFGISKVVEETSLEVTKTTAILGSGLYMSPEQMKSSKTVDHRTDVYALGISVFELLARTQPFTADSFAELAIKVNMEPPAELRGFRPDIPAELAEAIARAYAKKADERYQSMGEFALALEPWCTARTRSKIEALARTETRRGRAPSVLPPAAPGAAGTTSQREVSGSYPPQVTPPLAGSQLRFPRPPSLPTPSSMGLDTFGLSKKKDALGVTAEPGVSSIPKNDGGAGMLLGVGVGVGAVLALGVAAFMYVRAGRDAGDDAGALASAGSAVVASADARSRGGDSIVDFASDATANASGSAARVGPSGMLSGASVPRSGQPRSASASAVASTASAAPSAAPTLTPTSEPAVATETASPLPPPAPPPNAQPSAPCRIRDLDGTLRDCPKN